MYYEWKQAGKSKDPYDDNYTNMKNSKKELRKAQRQLTNSIRMKNYNEIMEASPYDQKVFYKLVNKQRKHKVEAPDEMLIEGKFVQGDELREGLATYFEQLATPEGRPEFDTQYKLDIDLKIQLLKEIARITRKPVPEATNEMVYQVIQKLKNNKAADELGLTSEHIKYGGISLVESMTSVINSILKEVEIPDFLKAGIVTPVHKKGKPAKQLDSLRRITVTAIIGKVFEMLLLKPTKEILDPTQNPMQKGFTERCSSTNAAFILTEAIAEAKDNNQPLYVTYMDASKAFDIVWHNTMLSKLHDRGVGGDLWLLLCNMYDGITTKIKWKGQTSRKIKESQGIRQGGNISADLFKSHGNPLLDRILHFNLGYHVGTIPVGAATCADDIAVASQSPTESQVLLNVCQSDADRERYLFGQAKTKNQIMGKASNPNCQLQLNNKPIDNVQTHKHLGILRDTHPTNMTSTMERIRTARGQVYSLMGAGLHGFNGLHPRVSLKLWNSNIVSILYYGMEATGITTKQLQKIEDYQRQVLRRIQHLPEKTSKAAIYLLLGAIPAEGIYDRRLLTFIVNLVRSEGTIEAALIRRQSAMKDLKSNSLVMQAKISLAKYQLPTIYELLDDPPEPEKWKTTLKRATQEFWTKQLVEEAKKRSSLKYLNTGSCRVGITHPLWTTTSLSTRDVTRATVKAKLLTGTYTLQCHRAMYSTHTSPMCQLCKADTENREHFLTTCPALDGVRLPYINKLKELVSKDNSTDAWESISSSQHQLTQLILDPSSPTLPIRKQSLQNIEHCTKRLCFALHCERSAMLGTPVTTKGPITKIL